MSNDKQAAISSTAILALKASLTAPLDDRIRLARQTVTSVEQGRTKCTDRLCQAAREVLTSVVDDKEASIDELDEAHKLKARLRSIDPRRDRDARRKGTAELDLTACAARDTDLSPKDPDLDDDPWLNPPPLPGPEWRRIIEVERLGGDPKQMIERVLDGHPATVQTFLRLFLHLSGSFVAGGPALASGPLFDTVKKILTEQNALPAEPEHFGEKLLEELRARD